MSNYAPKDVPYVHAEDDGSFVVKVKEASGQFWILSNPTKSKRIADHDLRNVRRKMCDAYAEVTRLRTELAERHDVLKAQLRPVVEAELMKSYGFGDGGR